jgi:8-oxo-dGTP pyrophosphatase MutT (NUDIX family)
VDRDVVGEWSLPGVAVEQEHFDRVAVMPEEYHSVLHVDINGKEYSIGHGDYLALTLPSGKKIYWSGQHNLSYAFFFEHFGDDAKGRLGPVRWRHADQHQDLNIGSLPPAGPPKNATPQEQIEFGLQTLNAANYRGYIENRKMARVEHATTTEELDAWDQGPEKGGVLDIDLDILIHPETAKPQDRKIFSEKLAKAAASAEVIFITNSSELQAVYPFGRSRPGFPLYINPNDAVSFGMELIREIVKQDVSRSEVRDQNVDGQARLVPAVFDLAERVPKKFWDRPIAIDLIADNTGTLTPHQEQAQPEDIRERVMKLLSHDGNRLIVNTGDDAHLVAESHRPLIEYLTGIGAQNRWFLTSAGGTVVSSLKENGELKNQAIAAPWSVALKTRLSKALVNAFYNEALARVQTGEIDIWGLSPFRISTSRTQVLYDIGRKKKNWETIPAGENKNIITYLLPDFLGRQAYIYDSGAKMAIGTTTSAAVYPWLDLGFFEAVAKAAKKFAGRVNDRIEFIPSMNFLDLSARTKLDGAQAILHQNPVSHEHQLVLTASIGDGLNDLPALNHSFAKAEAPEVGLSVALSHHEAFASRAADHVFISNLEKMDGAAEVLAWLNTIQGKTVRQLIAERRAQLHLQTWQRSEARFKKLEAQLEVLADPSRSLLTRGQVEEILGLVRSGALKLFGEDMDVLEMIDGKEKVVGVTDLMVVHLYGLLHRSVDVFVRLPNGKFLILRRPPGRVVPPNADLQKFNAPKFSIPGGHPSAGETYREGMEKELIEETGLPEGWKLEGELQSIGTEGEFTSPPEDLKNRERRAVYLYKASPREAELIRKRDSELTRVKQEKSKEAYKQWLHAEQVAHPGRGEAWSYHELSLAEIMEIIDGREVFLQENYGQGETETVRMIFEEDLLPFLLKDERVLQSLSMKRSELRSRKPEGGGRKAEGGKPSAIHHPPPDIRSEAVRPDLKNRAEMRSDGFGGREVKKDARELAARDAAARAENLNAEHTAVPGHIDHNAVGHLASAPDLSGGKLDVQGVRFTIIRYLHRLLSFLEPISRYQDYLAFFSLVNDRKNLITEPLVSQTPSAVTWFGPIGAGDGFLHLFRDQFPLAEPFLSMQSIFKIHKKYDILASQNVKLFNPDRSEVRSQPDRGRGKVEEGISGTVSIKTRSEMRGSQIADNRPQTKDNDQKQEPVKSKSQVSNRKSGKARSEIRTATSVLEKAVSQDRTDRMVKAIRKGVQPATVFVDAEDFPNLSTAQKNEYFYAALAGQGVRIVVYNEHGQVQDKELNALLKLDRVTRTDRDLSGAQIIFDRPNTPGIHLSKQILPSQELVQRLRKKVSFFKTHGQNGGTLAAALLWAWSGGEDAQMCEISRGRDGFWIVAESLVNALQKSYNATLAFAVAA